MSPNGSSDSTASHPDSTLGSYGCLIATFDFTSTMGRCVRRPDEVARERDVFDSAQAGKLMQLLRHDTDGPAAAP
jgi:hypothetical protein